MSDILSDQRRVAFRQALDRLIAAGSIANLNDWCTKAGLQWSTVGEFLSGRTRVPSDRTYAKLAAVVGCTVSELKGESPWLPDRDRRAIAALDALPPQQQEIELQKLELQARHAREAQGG